ncbi:MAG: hypothetical protein NC191_03700 [Muribaculaceae bacterium]|nr:hypothetical protein [Muribaculaceae bacterium]
MKKLLMAFTALILSVSMIQSVEAKTVQVTALEDFQASNPPQVLRVQMNANTRLDYDLMLFQGFQVTGQIAAQNGGLVFVPVSYVNYQDESMSIQKQYPAMFKGVSGLVRQNEPFFLVFPDDAPDSFQYYVPSNSDMDSVR